MYVLTSRTEGEVGIDKNIILTSIALDMALRLYSIDAKIIQNLQIWDSIIQSKIGCENKINICIDVYLGFPILF